METMSSIPLSSLVLETQTWAELEKSRYRVMKNNFSLCLYT